MTTDSQAPKAVTVRDHRFYPMLKALVVHDFDEATEAFKNNTSPTMWHNMMKAMIVLQQFDQLRIGDFEALITKPIYDAQEAIVRQVTGKSIDDCLASA